VGSAARAPEPGAIYRRIGVEPIVNGRSTFTILGGSLMPPVVLDAMREAAGCFVDLIELQEAVGRRLAELTRNEAAFVSGGAAAGLFLSAAASMARRTDDGILRLADLGRYPREFVIHRAHRVPYDAVIELAGGRLFEVGPEAGATPHGGPGRKTRRELSDAVGKRTAAVVYVPKPHLAGNVLPLSVVVEIARRHDVPVIVDAAAQLPPRENLWRFGQQGADLVLFSGGKGLCGPASTGLVLGTADAIRRVAANAAPLHRPGRPMKVGKEDMIGLLAAVEWYLGQDEGEQSRRYDAAVDHIIRWGHDRGDVTVDRVPYGEAGQPTPRVHVRLTGASPAERDAFLAALRETPPRIDLLTDEGADQAAEDAGFYVAPETLAPGEEAIVVARLEAELARFRDGAFLDPADEADAAETADAEVAMAEVGAATGGGSGRRPSPE
jgi:L-seryl-tRNA(Ser) seleniumtransferase